MCSFSVLIGLWVWMCCSRSGRGRPRSRRRNSHKPCSSRRSPHALYRGSGKDGQRTSAADRSPATGSPPPLRTSVKIISKLEIEQLFYFCSGKRSHQFCFLYAVTLSSDEPVWDRQTDRRTEQTH